MTLRLTDSEPNRVQTADQARAAMLIVALVILAIGCALVYPPAGLIVPGLLLYAASLGLSLRR
jgi:hypothetical protein